MLKVNNVKKKLSLSIFQKILNFFPNKISFFNNLLIIWTQLKNNLKLIFSVSSFNFFYRINYNWFFVLSNWILNQNFAIFNNFLYYTNVSFLNTVLSYLFWNIFNIFFKKFRSWIFLNNKLLKNLKQKYVFIHNKYKYIEKGWFFKKQFLGCLSEIVPFYKNVFLYSKIQTIESWPKNIFWYLKYEIKLWLNKKSDLMLDNIFLNSFYKSILLTSDLKNVIFIILHFLLKNKKACENNFSFLYYLFMIKVNFFFINLSKLKNVVLNLKIYTNFDFVSNVIMNKVFYIRYHSFFFFGMVGNKLFFTHIKNLISLFVKTHYSLIFVKSQVFNKWNKNFKFLNFVFHIFNFDIKVKICCQKKNHLKKFKKNKFSKKINQKKNYIKVSIKKIFKFFFVFNKNKIFFPNQFEAIKIYFFLAYKYRLYFKITDNFNKIKHIFLHFFKNFSFKFNKKYKLNF